MEQGEKDRLGCQVGNLEHFSQFKMAAVAILDFGEFQLFYSIVELFMTYRSKFTLRVIRGR